MAKDTITTNIDDHEIREHERLKTMDKEKARKIFLDAPALLRKYMARHGNWQQITSHVNATQVFPPAEYKTSFSWSFARCSCDLCALAAELVGDPETPDG